MTSPLAQTPSMNCTSAALDDSFGPAYNDCHSGNLDFTLLFEQSILSIGPSTILLLLALSRVYSLRRASIKTLPNLAATWKFLLASSLVALQLALLILWTTHAFTRASIPAAVLSLLDAVAVLGLSHIEHTRSVRPSFILSIYLSASILFDVVEVRSIYLRCGTRAIPGLETASIAIKLLFLILESQNKRAYLKFPFRSYPPEAIGGIFTRSFFLWLNPMFLVGFRKVLSLGDLFAVDKHLLSERLQNDVQRSWKRYGSSKRHSLVRVSLYCLRWPLAATVFPRICLIAFNYAQPFLIGTIITYVGEQSANKNYGYSLIAATGVIYLGMAISTVHYQHRLYRVITMFRGALVTLIYTRTLELEHGVYDESAALTLMSTDIDMIIISIQQSMEVWARTLEIAIGIWLLSRQLGWVSISPIIIVAIGFAGSAQIARFIGDRQKQWVQAVQRRVAVTASVLSSMKGVKMMGLSDVVSTVLHDQRVRELQLMKKFRVFMVLRSSLAVLPILFGPLSAFAIFAILTSVQGLDRLSTVRAFTSLAIISLLTTPAQALLGSLPQVTAATGCFDRIQTFLVTKPWQDGRTISNGGDSPPKTPDKSSDNTPGSNSIELQTLQPGLAVDEAVFITNASVRPAPDAPLALQNISLRIPRGSFTIITGPVGSGKSTLLMAILGERPCEVGSVAVASKRMAYCSQSIWLQNATVRVIESGNEQLCDVDQEWYDTVISVCALDEDIRDLPDGDDTIIGSRGIILSGGQKQRLALARAVFARREIVLLDDILSALDSSTQEKIMTRLLGRTGLFRKLECTVILATHAIQHLSAADHIIVLDNQGSILEQGTLSNLNIRNIAGSQVRGASSGQQSEVSKSRATTKTAAMVKPPSPNEFADLTRQTGDAAVYKYYLASIPLGLMGGILSMMAAYTFLTKFQQIWLSWYTEGMIQGVGLFTGVYAAFAVASAIFLFSSLSLFMLKAIPASGVSLHDILLRTVMHAPQSFFSTTDTGITLNRFSQDMTLIDGALPVAAVTTITNSMNCVASVGLISSESGFMALTFPPLLLALYFLQKVYLRTSRQIRFLELEAKSPLYSHFLETIEGLSTLRALGWQQHFVQQNLKYLDSSQKPYYLLYCIQRWLNLVLDLIVGAMGVIVVTLAFQLQGSVNGGLLGVALVAVLGFNQTLQGLISSWTALETSLGAVARLKMFAENTTPEDKAEENFLPGSDWPSSGAIRFHNVTASHGPNLAPALRAVNLDILPGENIGVCGRTGSGKSTLLSALLRLVELDAGQIFIDDVDLAIVPREMIRSCIVAIPQEPLILTGSVRFNVDPKSTSTDALITAALVKVQLWPLIESRGGLDAAMTAQPLSQGQQQLFGLARALLRANTSRLLVLDEAMSNVDRETDQVMQKVIRRNFARHTVITVAHRLDTIVDSDRIVVMEAGRVVEVGRPADLLAAGEGSVFAALQRQS